MLSVVGLQHPPVGQNHCALVPAANFQSIAWLSRYWGYCPLVVRLHEEVGYKLEEIHRLLLEGNGMARSIAGQGYKKFKHSHQETDGAIERWHATLKFLLRVDKPYKQGRMVCWLVIQLESFDWDSWIQLSRHASHLWTSIPFAWRN